MSSPLLPLPSSPAPPSEASGEGRASRTANRLTLTQSYALGDWIMQHQQQAKDEPDTQGAEHAAIDLGFPVTPANFTAARQARGIEKTKPNAPPTLEERVIQLESEILLLRAQLNDFNQWNRLKWEDLIQISSTLKSRIRILEQATFQPPSDPLFPGSPLKSEIPETPHSPPLLFPSSPAPSESPTPSDNQCPTPAA